MRITLLIVFVCLFGCVNFKNKYPLGCQSSIVKSSQVKFFNSGLKLEIPEAWECDITENKDSSISEVCLDTTLLFNKGNIHSITVTEYPFEQGRSKRLLKKELGLINKDESLTLLDYGYQYIGDKPIDWIYFKDSSLYNVIYYIYGEKYKVIDFSVSPSEDYENKLCYMLNHINTLDGGRVPSKE